jgi:hypothetical protein
LDIKEPYFLLARKLEEHWLWQEKPFSRGQAWVDLIMQAAFKDHETVWKNQVINVKRGQVPKSYRQLGTRWGWDKNKVGRFLTLLKKRGMCGTDLGQGFTLISIYNYETYQLSPKGEWDSNAPVNGTQAGHRRDKQNKSNKSNKSNNTIYAKKTNTKKAYKGLSDEFLNKCKANPEFAHIDVDLIYRTFTDYCKQKGGRPYADYEAAFRNFLRRDKQFKRPKDERRLSNVPKSNAKYSRGGKLLE